MSAYYDPHDSHDPHDSRSRHSRRHDSFNRHHEDQRVKSTAGPSHHRHHDEGRHDSHRHHGSHLGVDAEKHRSSRRSLSQRRRSWPPHPFAEDEFESLKREKDGLNQIKASRAQDAVPCRGQVDQEQLIIDIHDGHRKPAGMPTPPTSEDERARKAKRRPSRIHTDVRDEVPELGRRAASPYAFTKQSKPGPEHSSPEQFLSPNNAASSHSNVPDRKGAPALGSRPSSPRTESGRWSPGSQTRTGYFAAGDSAIDDSEDHASLRGGTTQSSRSTTINPSPRSSIIDFAPAPNTAPIKKFSPDDRRNTDGPTHVPQAARLSMDKVRKSNTFSDAYDQNHSTLRPNTYEPPQRSRESSYSASRAPSPTNNGAVSTSTPPRSPRVSADFASREPSAANSRAPSVSGSRPASPSPRTPHDSPRMPRPDLDWGAAFAANAVNAARKTKPPSRLATSMRQESVPDLSHRSRHDAPAPQASSLPYPEDDSPFVPNMISMPSERDHQFFGVPSQIPPYNHDGRPSVPPVPAPASKVPASPSRPTMHRGFSTSVLAPPGETKPPLEKPRRSDSKPDTFATSSQTKRDLDALLRKGLPSCPRSDPVAGYDDWYTVIGAPQINVCPDCVDSIFERSIFRPSLRRSPPKNLDEKVQCALGMPWNRIAWLLTLQQRRTDLNLLKDLTDIEATADPCPGNVESLRSWYGLRDPDGLFVRDFHVCPADVLKVQRLLPSLSSIFVRVPQRASYDKRTCALRHSGNRFSAYLDAMIATHDKTQPSSSSSSNPKPRPLDPMPLIDLIEHKTRLRECTRDSMLLGSTWHFLPSIPSLTVCEDCFEAVVEPEIRRHAPSSSSSDIGTALLRFHRTAQPALHDEGKLGSSCQLYSRRMRKVFRRALEEDDLKYLARKSRERREHELRLQEQYKDVLRRAKRLPGDPVVAQAEEKRLNKELRMISEEWRERWE